MTTQEKLIELKESTKGCGFQCHLETYTEAIEALKKQIPLPIKHQDTYDDDIGVTYSGNFCPACQNELFDVYPRHCCRCGQKIDWSEDNEKKIP